MFDLVTLHDLVFSTVPAARIRGWDTYPLQFATKCKRLVGDVTGGRTAPDADCNANAAYDAMHVQQQQHNSTDQVHIPHLMTSSQRKVCLSCSVRYVYVVFNLICTVTDSKQHLLR